MANEKSYSKNEATNLVEMNLDNGIAWSEGISKGDTDMPKRLTDRVKVNGQDRWVHGYSTQEMYDSYVQMLVREGLLVWVDDETPIPTFGDYFKTFYSTFKQKQEKNTIVNRNRIARNHILPEFGKRRIDGIKTTDIQKWFNELGEKYSKETILKIKNIMSPVFDAAVEDELMAKNPMLSKRLEIGGKETSHHKAIPKAKMVEIRADIPKLPWRERMIAALLSYTGMRMEEVLGLRYDDISDDWITVRRAVVHPNRNLPEVKAPKTNSSERRIPLHPDLKKLLEDGHGTGYILYTDKSEPGEQPLSYTEERRSFDKIRKRFSLEGYSAHDFRDTCATEWRENGMALDVVARLLGHSKTETTEKRYVKYRDEVLNDARRLMV